MSKDVVKSVQVGTCVGPEKGRVFVFWELVGGSGLSTESIEGTSLPLEGIHHIHSSDSFPLCMLSVGDSIPDDILQEHLENSPGLLVDESRDPLDTTSPCQTADGRLSDSLDVIPQDLAVTLGTTFSQSFASFASSSHFLSVFSETDARTVLPDQVIALRANGKREFEQQLILPAVPQITHDRPTGSKSFVPIADTWRSPGQTSATDGSCVLRYISDWHIRGTRMQPIISFF